jgi:bifunctional non-homologous end joining protein LigD
MIVATRRVAALNPQKEKLVSYNPSMPTRTRKPLALPRFIPPMLAKPGTPFDSDEHLFEVKWDGTRTLAFVENKQCRLLNRRQIEMRERYPEFECLARFPAGTVVDGETVVLRDGKPDFTLLLSREQACSPLKIKSLARSLPATYIVFDLLYERYRPVMELPLIERRRRLERLISAASMSHVILSQGIVGPGRAFFQEACDQGLEGIVAKRLDSLYWSGKRSDAWLKIKRQMELCCLIIGFEPSGSNDFRSLILAVAEDGQLCCVGKVGTGFTEQVRKYLNGLLWTRLRAKPVIPCKVKGKWIKPDLFCRVVCMERTAGGELRAAAFKGLIKGKECPKPAS